MSNRGLELIDVFNKSNLSTENDILLMPEFGGWMVEAVPTKPYGSTIDAAELLSCELKLYKRRKVLDEFFNQYGVFMASFANAPGLGTDKHIEILDQDLKAKIAENQSDLSTLNKFSKSRFTIDATINTHPRFGGVA